MMRMQSRIAGLVILLGLVAGCESGPTGPEVNLSMPSWDGDGGVTAPLAEVPPDLNVSDLADGVDLEQAARRWIGHAERLFTRATELAGPNPEPPISAWLEAARHMLDQAKNAFEAGNFVAAIAHAKASAEKSQDVIDELGGDRPDLEARAAEAIQHAEGLYREAVDLAGPDPERRVRTALAKAEELLDAAVRAYDAEDFRMAIRHAVRSAHISQTVIRYLES